MKPTDHAAINELHRLADGLRAIPGWKSPPSGEKTVARGGSPAPLPPLYREVWTLKPRRPVRSWIRLACSFAVHAAVWSAAVLAMIIVAAEVAR